MSGISYHEGSKKYLYLEFRIDKFSFLRDRFSDTSVSNQIMIIAKLCNCSFVHSPMLMTVRRIIWNESSIKCHVGINKFIKSKRFTSSWENWKQFARSEYYYGDDSRSAIRPSWNARFNDSITSLCIEPSYLELSYRMILYAILLSTILFRFQLPLILLYRSIKFDCIFNYEEERLISKINLQ